SGNVRLAAHLRSADHRGPDADRRGHFRASANEVRRGRDARAIWRRVRRLHTRDGRGDSVDLVTRLRRTRTNASAAARFKLAAGVRAEAVFVAAAEAYKLRAACHAFANRFAGLEPRRERGRLG